MERGFYYLPDDDLCSPYPLLVRPDQIQIGDHRKSPPIAWFVVHAAAIRASDWSRISFNFYQNNCISAVLGWFQRATSWEDCAAVFFFFFAIIDLSSPDGHSVYLSIPKTPFSVLYVIVDSWHSDGEV